MIVWAALFTLIVTGLSFLVGDPATVLSSLAELMAVLAVFALVCAAEAWN